MSTSALQMPAVLSPAVASASGCAAEASRLVRLGWGIILGAVVPLAVWMCLAPLSMAVVAPAFVKVDLSRRPVQHLEGGIVREALVRDGQQVVAGEPVVILGDVRVDADRNRLEYRVKVERAALIRLEAEQALASSLAFPADLETARQQDQRIEEVLRKEAALFASRRESLMSAVQLLKSQRGKVEKEIAALRAQIQQAENSLRLQTKDLEANRKLLNDHFISSARLAQLEAAVADYASKLEERRSELARAEQRLVDADLKINSSRNEYLQGASDQLKVTAARLGEIEQELRKSQDEAARQVVTAPASGQIIELRFTTPGAVVHPGEPIAEIVPTDVKLLIEAHIRPEEINYVSQGQRARIRFTAFKYRNGAMAEGAVSYVSADRLIDRATNLPYYVASIAADPASLKKSGALKLQAGMPAEVYIQGASYTPLQYLLEPITSTIRKAGREI